MSERSTTPLASRNARLHQLALRLILLIAITVVAFALTREAAVRGRRLTLRDARRFHDQGARALMEGRVSDAVSDLRRAATKDRTNPGYALALANALTAQGQLEGAERTLIELRATTPEDPEVNLALARLAARRQDETAALRYYRSALYAPWPTPEGTQKVRLELIEFLLDRHDHDRALAELVAARATAAPQASAHARLGTLFLRASEARLALEEFRAALRLSPRDAAALAGAGEAAYEAGDYAAALRYLADAPDTGTVAERRTIAASVVGEDPLAARVPAAVRLTRATAALAYVRARLVSCGLSDNPVVRDIDALQRPLQASRGRDTELLERAVDLSAAGVMALQACGPLPPRDRALAIIHGQHGGAG